MDWLQRMATLVHCCAFVVKVGAGFQAFLAYLVFFVGVGRVGFYSTGFDSIRFNSIALLDARVFLRTLDIYSSWWNGSPGVFKD